MMKSVQSMNALCASVWRMLALMCRPSDLSKYSVAELFAKLEVAYIETTNCVVETANKILIKQKTGETLVDFANKQRV